MIEKGIEFQDLWDRREEFHQGAKAAREEYRALERRHKVEEREAYLKKSNLEGQLSRASDVPQRLRQLQKAMPSLFTTGSAGHPPRLITPQEIPEPAEDPETADTPAENGETSDILTEHSETIDRIAETYTD